MRSKLGIGLAVVLAAMCAYSADRMLKAEDVSALAVPRMKTAPVIDGAIGQDEWRESAAISGPGLWNEVELIPRPTTFFLGWDKDRIYLACRTYLRPGYKPHVPNGRSPGLAFVFDDGLELVFKPMGRNVTFDDAGAAYKLFLNCLGHVGDLTRLELGQQLKNWAPSLKTGARITAPGTAPNGGSWWELEMSGSLSDFNLKGPNRVGDQWRVMLGINHFPVFLQARIPCAGSYFESECRGYTLLTLVEDKPAVQFTMDSLSNLATDGTAAMNVGVFNPGRKPAEVSVEVKVADAIHKMDTLSVPAGGAAEFALAEKLPDSVSNGMASVTAASGGETLLRYVTHFTRGAFAYTLATQAPPDPTKFTFSAVFNPVRGLLEVKADTYYLADPDAAQSLSYKVTDAEGAVIVEGMVTNIAEWYFCDLLTLPPLKPGTNTVEATMRLKDGAVLGPMYAKFEKLDEAKEFPEWWGKGYGNVERVLPPFEAIRRTGHEPGSAPRFSCWGREYALNSLGLPDALASQGDPVLAAPARLVVTVAGKDVVIPAGPAKITDQKDWRVRFEGRADGAGLVFDAKGWLEQDGLVYTELTYAPKDGKPVAVDAMRIEYPVSESDADCLLCIGPGNNFSSKTTMIIPKRAKGRFWSTHDTGKAGSQMTVGSFYPTVWIGNERRGFLWWADNDKGWFPVEDAPAHEALREKVSVFSVQVSGGTERRTPNTEHSTVVVLRNNIIGKPAELAGPRTVAFSYMGTPQKPLQAGWRSWAATEDGTFFTPHRSLRKDSKTGEPVNKGGRQKNWIHPESRYPEEWAAMWAEQKTNEVFLGYKGADAAARVWPFNPYAARNGVQWGHMSFTLHGYGEKSLESKPYKYFGLEWFSDSETWNESFTDYAMYLFSRAFKEGGVHSTYWDITFPILHKNLIGGLAYQLPDGRIQRGYNGWNIRRFFMRLHALAYDNGLLPGCNGSHSTHAYVTVALPWLDAVLDGERNWNLDLSDLDWVDYYPIERMRAMSIPHNWGLGICWMGNFDTTNSAKKSLAKIVQGEYVWMHDSWLNPYTTGGGMPTEVLDWGINSANTVYIPYWRNDAASADAKDALVSIWHIPQEQRAVVGVFNYNRKKPMNVTVRLDRAKLGLPRDSLLMRQLRCPTNTVLALNSGKAAATLKELPPHRLCLFGVAAVEPAALAAAEKALPAWVTNGLPDAVLDFGLVRPQTKFFEAGKAPAVSVTNAAVEVGMWQLPDRVLLTVQNVGTNTVNAEVNVDLEALGLVPRKWQEFIGVRDLSRANDRDNSVSLDFYGRKLGIKGLRPGAGRLVALRKY